MELLQTRSLRKPRNPEVGAKEDVSFWIVLGSVLFLALRIPAIRIIPPVFDEVVQLYMARDIATLARFPLYFYGQHYMGPLESYFLAPVLGVFGFSFVTARFFYQLFYMAFAAMFVGIVRKFFDRETAVYTFLLLAVLPYPALHFTAIVAYEEILTVMMLCLALLLGRSFFWLGFFSGIGFWCNGIALVWFAPLGLSLMIGIPSEDRRKAFLWTGVGAVAGLFPIWIHGLQTGTLIDMKGGGGGFAAMGDLPRLFYLFFARMKYFLSTNLYEPGSWAAHSIHLFSFFPFTLFAISLVAFAVSSLRMFHRLNPEEKNFRFFVVLPPFILAALYSVRNLVAVEGIRFYLPLLASYPFVVAWGIRRLPSLFWKRILLGFLVTMLTVFNGASLKVQLRDRSEMDQMVRILEENKATVGIGGMAVAYTLNALSHERITATPPLPEARYQAAWEAVRERGPQFYIAERGADPDLEQKLAAEPDLTKVSLAHYDVFYGLSPLLKELLGVEKPS